jgi:hypothetical protein
VAHPFVDAAAPLALPACAGRRRET